MSMQRSVAFVTILILAMVAMLVARPSIADSDYTVAINVKDLIVLPCTCTGFAKLPDSSATGRGDISISVNNPDDIPLNYRYTVSAGKVVGQGSNVSWDLNGNFGPGKYTISVEVDDEVGRRGRASKTVELVEHPYCDCPVSCPFVEIRSHKSQVRRGDQLDFEAIVSDDHVTYRWSVENGTIESGQGTSSLVVRAGSDKNANFLKADVKIGGINPQCYGAMPTSSSIPFGEETRQHRYDPTASVYIDERTLIYPCQGGISAETPSKDMIASVSVYVVGNTSDEKFDYRYEPSGGKIVGSGSRVNWDLTGVDPGNYYIKVVVRDSEGAQTNETERITVAKAGCAHVECPAISLSSTRVKSSDDYIVRASLGEKWTRSPELVWSVTEGTILAGQGTRSVRVRAKFDPNSTAPDVTMTPRYEDPLSTTMCALPQTISLQPMRGQ